MRLPRRLVLFAALALVLSVGGCGGQKDASQSGVHDAVVEYLTTGDRDPDLERVDARTAGEIADCIVEALFNSGDFDRPARNEVFRAVNGDPPTEEQVNQIRTLVSTCHEQAGASVPG